MPRDDAQGFNDKDIVALSGAHTVGKCNLDRSGFDGPWTEEPLKFDNTYFKEREFVNCYYRGLERKLNVFGGKHGNFWKFCFACRNVFPYVGGLVRSLSPLVKTFFFGLLGTLALGFSLIRGQN